MKSGMVARRKSGIIRRRQDTTPLHQKVLAAPGEQWLSFHELSADLYDSIHSLPRWTVLCTGALLNASLLALRVSRYSLEIFMDVFGAQLVSPVVVEIVGGKTVEPVAPLELSPTISESLSWLLIALEVMICIFSIYPMVAAYNHRRSYQLLCLDADTPVSSSNARLVDLETVLDDDDLTIWSQIRTQWNNGRLNGSTKSKVWLLSIWNPSPFHLSLMCAYSPLHVALDYAATPENIVLITAFIISMTAMLSTLVTMFESQQRDIRILNAQSHHEYSKRFVYPRVFPARSEMATDTMELQVDDIFDMLPLSSATREDTQKEDVSLKSNENRSSKRSPLSNKHLK